MKNIYILLLIFFCVALGILIYFYTNKEEQVEITNDNITKDNFTLSYTYTGESKWTYIVTGTLPNPCYEVTTDALVAESYPEQVSVIVNVTPPDADMVCAQVIQEYEYTSEFSASDKAIVNLQVM